MEFIEALNIPKSDDLYKYSDPIQAQINTNKYLGKDIILYKSTNPKKKYMVYDDFHDKWKHFGSMKPPYQDYLKHKNDKRQKNYLARASNIKGNWKNNKYSSNNLSQKILWN
jgi:type III secretory pathway component EscR